MEAEFANIDLMKPSISDNISLTPTELIQKEIESQL